MRHLQENAFENGKILHSIIYELETGLTSYCYMIPETYALAWAYDDATIVLVVVAYLTLMCTQYLAAAAAAAVEDGLDCCLEITLTSYGEICDASVRLQL